MNDVLIQPFLAGLSTGLFCCVHCLPFMAPILVAEQRSPRETAGVLGWFILGRLGGYVLAGALFGWLGSAIPDTAVLQLVPPLALVVMSVLLVLYGLGVMKPGRAPCFTRPATRARAPLFLGFLMGVNICPPFLMSAAYVFTLHSVAKGVLYFLVFFVATTLYLLPLFFLGFLSRMGEFRWVARVSAVLVGLLFSSYGGLLLWRGVVP